jgi:hypothetical protein
MSFRRYLATFALVALGGCVADDRSLTINDFVAPVVAGSSCTIDPGAMSLASGTWDVLIASQGVPQEQLGYDLFLAVQNNIALQPGMTIDTASFFVNSFDVELETIGPVGNAIPDSMRQFNYPASSVRVTPGSVVGGHVEAVPGSLAGPIAGLSDDPLGTIVAHVRPVATRAEEQVVGAFAEFPIKVCNGCLTNDDKSHAFPTCASLAAAMAAPLTGNACNISQDAPVTCCNQSTSLLCGSAAAAEVAVLAAAMP